jgi:hypothetical protein
MVRASAGQQFVVRFTLNGVIVDVPVQTPSGVPFWVEVPPGFQLQQGDTAEVVGKSGSRVTAMAAVATGEKGEYVLASHTIIAGNMNIGTAQFAMRGTFDVRADSVDTLVGSPTFGQLDGAVPAEAFQVFATPVGGGPDVVLRIDTDQPLTTNIAEVLTAPDPSTAVTNFSVPVSGHLLIGGQAPVPFNGVANGQSQYRPIEGDGRENYQVTLTFTSPLGSGTATLATVGRTVVMRQSVSPCNPADIARSDSTVGADGCVDNGDFGLFIAAFFNADCTATCNP